MSVDSLVGKRFDRLLVVKQVRTKAWLCECDCGNQITLTTSRLLQRKSCGCMNTENRKSIGERSTTHGQTESRLYHKWCGMKERCHNPNYKYFSRYGGRGIKICDEWDNSFQAFEKWAYENGYDEELSGVVQSIDRIDTDGDYCPENCKWSTQIEQVRNRSISVNFIYNGKEMNPYEFCDMNGITNKVFVYRRLKKGDTPEKILHDWNMLKNSSDVYMTRQEACEQYGVCLSTLENWIKKGKIKAEKINSMWRIPRGQKVS